MEIKNIRLVISQPTVRKAPSEWDCTVDALVWEQEYIATRSSVCQAVLTDTLRDGITDATHQYLRPGDKQCSYCKAKAECPGYAKMVGETALGGFEVLKSPDPVPAGRDAIPIEVNLLASYYLKLDLIRKWCDAVESKAYALATAGQIGEKQGLKMVAGKDGNRAWKDAAVVEELFKEMRLPKDQMYDHKLISPTTAEKLLAENPRKWKKVEAQIERKKGGLKLVHISAKGDPVSVGPNSDGFDDVSESTSQVNEAPKEDNIDDLF